MKLCQAFAGKGGDIVTVRRLWSRKLPDGPEVIAHLFFDASVGDATLELTIKAAHAEDLIATEIGDALRKVLDEQGATEIRE
jgi:hypothetical protein